MNSENSSTFLVNLSNENRKINKLVKSLKANPDNSVYWNALGQGIMENNYLEESLTFFDRAIAIDSSNGSAWLNKGKAYFQLRKYQESLGYFDHAITLSENNGEAWLNKGKAYFQLRKYQESLDCIITSMNLSFFSYDSYLLRGINNYYLGNYQESLKDFEQCQLLDPVNYKSWLNAGIVLTQIQDYRLAEQCLKKAYELDPNEIDVIRNLSYLYSDILFKFDEALILCKKLYQMDSNPEWTYYLAETLIKAKQYATSRNYLQKAQKLEDENRNRIYTTLKNVLIISSYLLEGKNQKGYMHLNGFLKNWENNHTTINNSQWVFTGLKKSIFENALDQQNTEMLIDLIELIEGKGENFDTLQLRLKNFEKVEDTKMHENIQRIKADMLKLYKLKLKEEGIDMYYDTETGKDILDIDISDSFKNLNDLSIQLDTTSAGQLDLDLINLMIVEGRFNSVIDLCDSILTKIPNHIGALLKKGYCLYRIGRSDEALRHYDEVINLDNRNAEAMLNKAMIIKSKGNHDESERLFKQVVQLELLSSDYDGFTSKGIALTCLGFYDEALNQFDKAISINSRMDRAIVNKGIVYARLNNYPEATRWYDEALKINKKSFLAIYNKACLSSRIGDTENAITLLKEAIKLNPYFKDFARSDDCFKKIENNEEFKILLEDI